MFNLSDNLAIYSEQDYTALDLAEKKIVAKQFDNCCFNSCNFSKVEFKNCKFTECKFIDCNLSSIGLKDCFFFEVVFEGCKTIGINWPQARWPHIQLASPIQFYKCILNDSSFFGLNLTEIVMIECCAHEVDFREADCTKADFSFTDFQNSLFNKTNLTQANFTEAINYNINIFFNQLKKAKFSLPEAQNLLRSLEIELVE